MSAVVLVALALFVPGPDDPVCESWQTVEVDHCVQGQLPEETIGREMDEPEPEPTQVVHSPTATTLAHTGPAERFYVVAGAGLIAAGSVLVRVHSARRR